jgi:hypothetical protein
VENTIRASISSLLLFPFSAASIPTILVRRNHGAGDLAAFGEGMRMRVYKPGLAVWALLLAATVIAAEGAAAPPKNDGTPAQFLRLTRDKDRVPLALETLIVRYAPAKARGPAATVDLVAAIHIADKSYYAQLNHEFESYDAVLYELVAPEKSPAPRPGDAASHHPITLLQTGMKDLLGLEYQLQGIDYTRPNMIHADMSPKQFAEEMNKRGESAMTMLARMFGYALTHQDASADGSGGQLLMAFFDKNRNLALKRAMAEQFVGSEGSLAALEGPAGSTLIGGRNQVALEVLRKQIAAGKRKIAIFYGAAHMPDMQKRLCTEFKLTPVSTRWLTAWNLKP